MQDSEKLSERQKRNQLILQAMRPLLVLDTIDVDLRQELCTELGISTATFYRQLKKLKERPTASAIDRKKHNFKPGSRLKGGQRASSLLEETINRIYLDKQRTSVAELYRHIVAAFYHEDIEPPHEVTVWRYVQKIEKSRADRSRMGAREYKISNSPKTKEYTVNRPAQVIQIDSTTADLIVVDRKERLPIGRPTITVAMDICTRLVTGFKVSVDGPTSNDVAAVIAMSCYPKDELLTRTGIAGSWPSLGVPESIHVDNGSEHTAVAIDRGLGEHGIKKILRPVGTPHYGGHVESLLRTFMLKIHSYPGTTFSNVRHRGKYDSEGRAVLTLDELERLLTNFVVNEYHVRKHSGLETSPLNALDEFIKDGWRNYSPKIPKCEFEADFRTARTRSITRAGVRYDNIYYWSPDVQELFDAGVQSVLVYPIEADVTCLDIRTPDGSITKVPCKSASVPQCTRSEWRRIKSRLEAKRPQEYLTPKQLAENVSMEMEIISTAKSETRRSRKLTEKTQRAITESGSKPALAAPDETNDDEEISFSADDILPTSTNTQVGDWHGRRDTDD